MVAMVEEGRQDNLIKENLAGLAGFFGFEKLSLTQWAVS
jgi:hypothetical protein